MGNNDKSDNNTRKLYHRAFYKPFPEVGRDDNDDGDNDDDVYVESIEFVIDCFRIVRDMKEHHRPARTGASRGCALAM